MWTSIAEVLDVPPEGRIPPGFFDHVAHRTALFVLDNLEQIEGADTVVAELLDHAPQAVAVATSRKPLAVAAQHIHPVPPLELPEDGTVEQAQEAGAVQLFVQHARKVKPSFTLTADNAGEVTAVCRRLDGLPLAIELAAARTRLLTPKALLGRLDQALDIQTGAVDQPARQKTLRDTIAWSFDLLTDEQQALFRRLGVFTGGADLDAVAAVTGDVVNDGDPLDLIGDLVDASLLTVTETFDGEPRIGMLETVRAFARDELKLTGELEQVQQKHLGFYAQLAAELEPLVETQRYPVRRRFEVELDNFREAMGWCLDPAGSEGRGTNLQLIADFVGISLHIGYLVEGRSWLERAVAVGAKSDPYFAVCLARLGQISYEEGNYARVLELAGSSLEISRELGDTENALRSLVSLGLAHLAVDDEAAARSNLQEAIVGARRDGNPTFLIEGLSNLLLLEEKQGNRQRASELLDEVEELTAATGDVWGMVWSALSRAELEWKQGDPEAAQVRLRSQITDVLELNEPSMTISFAETCAMIWGQSDAVKAARLLGAADAMREREGRPREPLSDRELQPVLDKIRAHLTPKEWGDHYLQGRGLTVEDLLIGIQQSN